MLDRRDPGAHSKLNSLCTFRMSRDFSFELGCFINHRLQLFEGVLRRTNRISLGKYPASSACLDHIGPVLDLIANGRANLLRTISDTVFDPGVFQTGTKSILLTMATPPSQ